VKMHCSRPIFDLSQLALKTSQGIYVPEKTNGNKEANHPGLLYI